MAAPTSTTSAAPSATSSSSGGAIGGAGDETMLQAKFAQLQRERGPEAHPDMPAPQLEMKSLPDCGEKTYVGSGKLKEKVALITGGDSGIGRAVAIAFAREGADVAIVYAHHDEDAKDTARYVEEAGRKCLLIKADVSKRAECEEAVERTVRELGSITTLINNAGVQYEEKTAEDCLEHLDEIFATNIFSCFYLTAAVLKHFKEHSGCTIVSNSSINAYVGNDHLISYTATKGAIHAWSMSMAKNLAGKGIRINTVAPGPIWTPFITGAFDAKKNESFGEKNPMGRAGQPAECAGAFVFLASGDSTYINASCIHVDGGQYTSS